MQVRVNASKTIARPQFRELIYQFYFDPDSNRTYRGNPLLVDSELTNAEAPLRVVLRAATSALGVAGFYKKIKNPIEAFVAGESLHHQLRQRAEGRRSTASSRGAEELRAVRIGAAVLRRPPLRGHRQLHLLEVEAEGRGRTTPSAVFAAASSNATDYFRDGAPLTGQSEHIANVAVRPREQRAAVAADASVQLRQRAGHQPRPGQQRPARHHRISRPADRLRRARGLRGPRLRVRDQVRGPQPHRAGRTKSSSARARTGSTSTPTISAACSP